MNLIFCFSHVIIFTNGNCIVKSWMWSLCTRSKSLLQYARNTNQGKVWLTVPFVALFSCLCSIVSSACQLWHNAKLQYSLKGRILWWVTFTHALTSPVGVEGSLLQINCRTMLFISFKGGFRSCQKEA